MFRAGCRSRVEVRSAEEVDTQRRTGEAEGDGRGVGGRPRLLLPLGRLPRLLLLLGSARRSTASRLLLLLRWRLHRRPESRAQGGPHGVAGRCHRGRRLL